MKILLHILIAFSIAISLSCGDFVNDVDDPLNITDDDALMSEEQFEFLISGVKQRFATTYGQLALLSDVLSDQFVFDETASPTADLNFRQFEDGQIRIDNPATTRVFAELSELRFLADDLLARAPKVNFSDAATKRRVLFTGNLYGGIARYFYATYIGLREREGGGVIDGGEFIASPQMYDLAIDQLEEASSNAPTELDRRAVNTVLAKANLLRGNLTNTLAAAINGLQQGDAPLQALYSTESPNPYWAQAGRGNTSVIVHSRLVVADSSDPRFLLEPVPESTNPKHRRQAQYTSAGSPIPLASWQENELILAEARLQNGEIGQAVDHLNNVRVPAGLPEALDITTESLLTEREQTLFAEGLRLADQRRYNLFHLPVGTWQYLPLPEEERVANPNIE